MDILGRSPVPWPLLVTGKLAYAGSALFFLVKIFYPESMLYDSPHTRAAGASLYLAGLAVVIAALVHLGESAAVGLPDRETKLKTRGLYRFSRNPVYLGAFTMCTGSCLWAIHPLNIILFAITVPIHLSIVNREEEFLEQRFGQEWLEYRRTVPRFIGWHGGSAPGSKSDT